MLGVALARMRSEDEEAKSILSKVHGSNELAATKAKVSLVTVKIYLARVLRRLGEEEKSKEL